MKKNTLLNAAIIICKSLRIFYVILFVILTGFFVHFQINPSFYKNPKIKNITFNNIDLKAKTIKDGSILAISKSWKRNENGKVLEDGEVFILEKIAYTSLYMNFIQYSLVLFFIYLCITKFQKILQSVRKTKTFSEENIVSFRRIGKYLLIIFLITCYTSIRFQQGGISGFQLNFTYLILALVAYIIAEIFKEGNNIKEENILTI